MRIGELAQAVGVSTDTVRFYELSGWCHSGHCADSTTELPRRIEARRAEIADRMAGLQALDARLADLLGHLERPRRPLAVLDGPCCEAAGAVVGAAEGGCPCCSS